MSQSGYFVIVVLQYFYPLDNFASSDGFSAGITPPLALKGRSVSCFSFAINRIGVENGQQYSGVVVFL